MNITTKIIASMFLVACCVSSAYATTKIIANDAQEFDFFGTSVAISGDYAIVGATGEDAGGSTAGAAYIYHRTGTNSWGAGVKIVADDAGEWDYFGRSVGISGNYAIVGAHLEDTKADGAGAAYIFYRTDTNSWDTGTKIMASDGESSDQFGVSVSISGDYAIVGAEGENGGPGDPKYDAGAAYIFHRTDTNTWDSGTKIMASDAQGNDYFGCSVGISGSYAIVGAYQEDEFGSSAGAAYIFSRTGETWDGGTKITASDAQASDQFGYSVGISGSYAIAGAWYEDTGGNNAGSAYIYRNTGANIWNSVTKIQASDKQASDFFGKSVSISGDYAIAGAYREGSQGNNAGAAYIFERTDLNAWDTQTKIVASDPEADDNFGSAVAISGSYAIASAPYETSAGDVAGAAYIYCGADAAVDLLYFEAQWADEGAILSWLTGTELDCGAFTILRCPMVDGQSCDDGDYEQLADVVVPCEDSVSGAEYNVFDFSADQGFDYSYMLREYETTGGVNHYGPALLYADNADTPDDDMDSPGDDEPDHGDDDGYLVFGADSAEDGADSEAADEALHESEGGCGW